MSVNSQDAFNFALELFSSLYEDLAPTDLPQGLSPQNSDVWYLPGQVQTRPALNATLVNDPEPLVDKVSVAEFALPSGDYLDIMLYLSGNVWQQDTETLAYTKIATVSPGTQFRSVTAFDKQWFAFYNQPLSQAFTESPFSGADVPRYYDGQNTWRVTQDPPAFAPTFSNVPIAPVTLVQSNVTGTVTITGVNSSGLTYTTIIVNGKPEVRLSYTTITYTCSVPPPSTWIGTTVTVTGCTGTNASLANVTGIVTAVSGLTFTLNRGTGPTNVVLTGQSATATVAGSYFIRSGNIVTAYTSGVPSNFSAGLYAQILNSNGTQIDGTNWTISAIARDATGLVTVTISTQLTNLPPGTTLFINASDTTDFPASFQQVFQVLSASGGTTTFTISDSTWGNGAVVSSTGGNVFQQWSGVFQILSIGVDSNGNNFFTYFQLGPDATLGSTGGTPQAQIEAQIPAGPRSAVLIFQSVDGAQTAPSIPIQLSVDGGTNLLSATDILIGPPGTAKRIIAFTPAFGASYFYITPSYLPSTAGISPVLSLGTIINDNTSIAATLDFSDAQLTAGTEIDIQGNNLFNQVVLAPCLGCIEYEGRMGWWGEINDIKNLLNNHFDGGYTPLQGTANVSGNTVTIMTGNGALNVFGVGAPAGTTIYINGVPYVIQSIPDGGHVILTTSAGFQTGVPWYILSAQGIEVPGWESGEVYLINQPDKSLGFAAQMTASASGSSELAQSCYQDYYGAPIIQPNKTYFFRALATLGGGPYTTNQLSVEIFSPSLAAFLALGTITVFPTTQGWISVHLDTITAVTNIPSDVQFQLIFDSPGASAPHYATLTLDEIELIDDSQPVLFQQMRLSYFDNPFGYDDETGLLGIDGSAKITAAFKQRSYLYALTDGPLYQTQNNGSTEPDGWSFTAFADACDCFGPNAVDTSEDVAWWAGNTGLRLFLGSTPKKISQEIQPTWEAMDTRFPTSAWLVDDPIERILYMGAALNNMAKVLAMSYRSVDAVYNVPDPLHTSYSGKMIATDLCRKWTIWNIPMNSAAIFHRAGVLPPITTTVGNVSAHGVVSPTLVAYPVASAAGMKPGDTVSVSGNSAPQFNFSSLPIFSVSGNTVSVFLPGILSGSGSGGILIDSTPQSASLDPRVFFGGGLNEAQTAGGNLYSLTFGKFTDDDYGQIFSFYTTYFFFNHDIEQNTPNLGLHQKVYTYLTAYITGVGTIQPTALVNNLNNPWQTVATVWDPINQMWAPSGSPSNPFAAVPLTNGVLLNDLEWGLNIKGAARVAIRWAPSPLPGQTDSAFQLTHMVLSCRDDRVRPVRGSNK